MTVLRHYERQRRNRKNPGIASLHCVSVAMTNLRCVSPVNYELRKRSSPEGSITNYELLVVFQFSSCTLHPTPYL
ncbi:MAG: hypothetical protein F6K61_08885 [Sphaerospermopsis sp. SIO1G1]|nr:hypothetical protein [Sphaerospermopsis sp. SIO1G1]